MRTHQDYHYLCQRGVLSHIPCSCVCVCAVREASIQIIIMPHHCWRETDYKGWKHVNASQLHANEVHGFAAGTWGEEFNPEFGDVVVYNPKELRLCHVLGSECDTTS